MPKRAPALSKLGQIIRSRRESLKLSQEDLADKADLDRTYIGGIERGERNPPFQAHYVLPRRWACLFLMRQSIRPPFAFFRDQRCFILDFPFQIPPHTWPKF